MVFAGDWKPLMPARVRLAWGQSQAKQRYLGRWPWVKQPKVNQAKHNTMKAITTSILVCIAVILTGPAHAGPQTHSGVTIPQRVLTYPAGHYLRDQLIPLGFDAFGYNYQAHTFRGYYANAFLGADGLPPYTGDAGAYLAAHPGVADKSYWPDRDIWVEMKWNDAWLSNADGDGDGVLDRHPGNPDYPGSGAWLTNHLWGNNADGSRWSIFAKFVAVPLDAINVMDVWYDAAGTEIGPEIWGSFAIIQEIINDPAAGEHGKHYGSYAGPGLGWY